MPLLTSIWQRCHPSTAGSASKVVSQIAYVPYRRGDSNRWVQVRCIPTVRSTALAVYGTVASLESVPESYRDMILTLKLSRVRWCLTQAACIRSLTDLLSSPPCLLLQNIHLTGIIFIFGWWLVWCAYLRYHNSGVPVPEDCTRASCLKSSLFHQGTREGISKSICTNPQTGIIRNQPQCSSTGMGQSIMLDCSAAPETYDLLTVLDLSYLLSEQIVNSVLLLPLAPSV